MSDETKSAGETAMDEDIAASVDRGTNPRATCEAFLASVPEEVYAVLPDDILDVVDSAATRLLADHPRLADRPRALKRLVRRAVLANYRGTVGWEFDQEKCEAFMELLLKYLPLFLAII
jgi:hypothetical protein